MIDLRAVLLDPDAISVVFQPIVDLATGRTAGYEALARFSGGQQPGQVFAAAAGTEWEDDLDLACAAAALASAAALPREAFVSINLAPSTLETRGPELGLLLERIQRPVMLEMTEYAPCLDPAAVITTLSRLGPAVGLAIDDAGAGHADVERIRALRPGLVKLDAALLAGRDEIALRARIDALVAAAVAVGADLLAEGIEDSAGLFDAQRLGCRYGQGYYLGRPAAHDEPRAA